MTAVFLTAWVGFTGLERWNELAPWSAAMAAGLFWAGVVAGTWWFAEWTLFPRARHGADAGADPRGAAAPDGEPAEVREARAGTAPDRVGVAAGEPASGLGSARGERTDAR
ncbi:hypothetical protein [Streptomyces sp. NPDC051000]|uniref:hypothetical protein n=1 Tax=Streptomyces sp. NPDC051000 TaxID=3155520 RepID=UPI003404470A